MPEQSRESEEFARAFGDALARFLRERGLRQSDVAKRLGLGRRGEARLSTYCHDSRKGKRANPNAEVLYRVCTELGFEFEYKGYKITAATLNGHRPRQAEKAPEQLRLEFSGQFDLTQKKGTASVRCNRAPRRVDLTVYLEAIS
jgi:transcriptional regulator with XRE-family HTH domain